MNNAINDVSQSLSQCDRVADANGSDGETLPLESLFDALSKSYNYLTIKSFPQTFVDLVVDHCCRRRREGSCRLLDIGCGSGIGRNTDNQWTVKSVAGELWGIEPDDEIQVSDGLFDNFQHALMETATLPADYFDVAYSAMVMEHVADPQGFLQAVQRCLKPGGVYLFVTPNAQSFVPWATKTLHQMHVDELAIRLIRGKQVDEYHYPVQFLCNTSKQIGKHAATSGFLQPEFVYVEGTGNLSYLRGPLAPIRALLAWKRRRWRNPENLSTLICRLTKRP